MKKWSAFKDVFHKIVIVSALGYFVDIYDLLLFSIVRIPSLQDLGLTQEQILEKGVLLINFQMAGLLLGGIFWGILGDKKGRLSVLFGSIFLYSIANFLNAFVMNTDQYLSLRFLAGLGLAGELGAAITLVSEVLSKETRAIGTTIVASFGILGAVVAGFVASYVPWRYSYAIGGLMGFCLLIMRVSVYESPLFNKSRKQLHTPQSSEIGKKAANSITNSAANKSAIVDHPHMRSGDLRLIFTNLNRLTRFLACIAVGIPIWYVVGILITFSPEMSQFWQLHEPISTGSAIMYNYAGLSIGDLLSGLLSHHFQSRKKIVGAFLIFNILMVVIYFSIQWSSLNVFYLVCFLLGISCGFWAIFVSIAAEQFGTNLRATVATTTPNFVRGALIILTSLLQWIKTWLDLKQSAIAVGVFTFALAIVGLYLIEETFGRDLDFNEK